MSIGEGIQVSYPFKPKGGDGTGEGSPDPSSQGGQAEGASGGDAQGVGHCTQTPFLNPDPSLQWYGVKNVAKVRINGASCMALLNNGAQINTITLEFCWGAFPWHRAPDRPCRQTRCLRRIREWCFDPTFRLCHNTGSSGLSPGLLSWGPNSLGNPGLVKLCAKIPCYSGDFYDKLHHKHDKREGDRHLSNAMGKCPSGLSPGGSMGYSYSRRQ